MQDAQHASKILVDHALARFSTDNLSCMVIRLDSNRVKDVVNNKAEPIGVDGDPSTNVPGGVSEADKIVESARKSMAKAGIADNPELAEQAHEEVLAKMASSGEDKEPGPELNLGDNRQLPSVDILSSSNAPQQNK
jgi:protein phosphatase PTC1